jgi:hypothetical protein
LLNQFDLAADESTLGISNVAVQSLRRIERARYGKHTSTLEDGEGPDVGARRIGR